MNYISTSILSEKLESQYQSLRGMRPESAVKLFQERVYTVLTSDQKIVEVTIRMMCTQMAGNPINSGGMSMPGFPKPTYSVIVSTNKVMNKEVRDAISQYFEQVVEAGSQPPKRVFEDQHIFIQSLKK